MMAERKSYAATPWWQKQNYIRRCLMAETKSYGSTSWAQSTSRAMAELILNQHITSPSLLLNSYPLLALTHAHHQVTNQTLYPPGTNQANT